MSTSIDKMPEMPKGCFYLLIKEKSWKVVPYHFQISDPSLFQICMAKLTKPTLKVGVIQKGTPTSRYEKDITNYSTLKNQRIRDGLNSQITLIKETMEHIASPFQNSLGQFAETYSLEVLGNILNQSHPECCLLEVMGSLVPIKSFQDLLFSFEEKEIDHTQVALQELLSPFFGHWNWDKYTMSDLNDLWNWNQSSLIEMIRQETNPFLKEKMITYLQVFQLAISNQKVLDKVKLFKKIA